MDREIVTREGNFVVPYFPLDRSQLMKVIQKGGAVDVIRVEGKELILSFTDEIYRSYPLRIRCWISPSECLSVAIFAVFFYVVMTVWWRDLEVKGWTDLDFSLGKSKNDPCGTVDSASIGLLGGGNSGGNR